MEQRKPLDRKRIVTKDIKDDLLCKICMEVLDDPVECSECNTAYCKACIDMWRTHNPTCPNRCSNAKLQKPHKLRLAMLNNLQVSCENEEAGCKAVTTIGEMEKHVGECPYRQIHCPNQRCPYKGMEKDMKEHEKVCEYEMVVCDKGCDQPVLRREINNHSCVKALKEIFTKEQTDIAGLESRLNRIRLALDSIHENLNIGVACDVCKEANIRGDSYRCTVCDKFNLCEVCYKLGKHAHEMERVRSQPIETELLEVNRAKCVDAAGAAKLRVELKVRLRNPHDNTFSLRFISSNAEDDIEYIDADYFTMQPGQKTVVPLKFEVAEARARAIGTVAFRFHCINYERFLGHSVSVQLAP